MASGVVHGRLSCYYEPDTNPTYQDMASHYGLVVLPARVREPRDKAKAETGVQIVERQILARLRNHTFFSLTELNKEIMHLLAELNNDSLAKSPARQKIIPLINKRESDHTVYGMKNSDRRLFAKPSTISHFKNCQAPGRVYSNPLNDQH